jgi:hypothetical protein
MIRPRASSALHRGLAHGAALHGRMNHRWLIGDELRPRSVRRDERQSGKRYNRWLTVFSLLEERTHYAYH